ncbi:hypothetical protein [Bacillus sp. SM2101]|uniref:hypothetical protein n=1 Tax=Bacillus sp. SM2101 TaxID=2805366 RepID=UPI001BDEDC13|nr:hypothetical protein [Bacillus sp. SM2101]
MELQKANDYFINHLSYDDWMTFTNDKQQSALNTAETMLVNSFTLRPNYADSNNFHFAVYEQAIHLLMFSKDRYRLQQEGVKSYGVDDVSVSMDNTIISPIAKKFLRPLIKRHWGKIV